MGSHMNHDFDEEKNELGKLTEACEILMAYHKEFCEENERLRQGWKGNSAEKYLDKSGQVKNRMEADIKNMEQVIFEIRKISQLVFEAESKNKITAERRGDQ